MNRYKSILFFSIIAFSGLAVPLSATTIPAGTAVVVKTTTHISSRDHAGRSFQTQLARSLVADGKVIVPAGATITGVVKSPVVRVGSTTRPLTLRLTGIVIHGHSVPIKTDDLEMDDTSPWTVGRRGIQVTGSAYMISSGAVLQFRLKAPAEV